MKEHYHVQSAADDSSNEISASARLSFSQFLRKGNPNRSSSHEHDSRGPATQLCLPNVALAAFSSGNSSPMVVTSHEASRLSNLGGEHQNTRLILSPLQTLTSSKRRARTYPRDFSASVRDVVELRTSQVKLGANHDMHPLTLSQLACELGDSNAQICCNVQPDLPTNSHPSLQKSKTADQARFIENKAYMSATDAAAHKGALALGSCGRTALPLPNGTSSRTQRLLEVHPSNSTACQISQHISL